MKKELKILILLMLIMMNLNTVFCQEILTFEQKLALFFEFLKTRNSDFCFYVFSNMDSIRENLIILETKGQIKQYVLKLEDIYSNYQSSTGFKKIR